MSEEHLIEKLSKSEAYFKCPREILAEIAEKIRPTLNTEYMKKLESVILSSQADVASQLKKSHGEFQEQIRGLYQNICIFESGTEIFDGMSNRVIVKNLALIGG